MIDSGKISCHWRAERHETIRTFQNVLPRHLADRFVEIGIDKRGEICFYKSTYITIIVIHDFLRVFVLKTFF